MHGFRVICDLDLEGQAPPAMAGRIITVSLSPTAVSRPSSTRTSSSFR